VKVTRIIPKVEKEKWECSGVVGALVNNKVKRNVACKREITLSRMKCSPGRRQRSSSREKGGRRENTGEGHVPRQNYSALCWGESQICYWEKERRTEGIEIGGIN